MSEGEAAVLFEFLDKASGADAFGTQAERVVVWRTVCLLEKQIAMHFDPSYAELIVAARAKIEREG